MHQSLRSVGTQGPFLSQKSQSPASKGWKQSTHNVRDVGWDRASFQYFPITTNLRTSMYKFCVSINFIVNCNHWSQARFSRRAVPFFHSHQKIRNPVLPGPHQCFSRFLLLAMEVGAQWYATVVLIAIFLPANEHVFMSLPANSTPSYGEIAVALPYFAIRLFS